MQQRTDFELLPANHRFAVQLGWSGWESSPDVLMSAWPDIPRLDECPPDIARCDWERLKDAALVSAERRSRWVWHDIVSEAVRLVPAGQTQSRCAIEAMDALNMITEEEACVAAAAACRSVVQAVGAPAARLITMMAYSGCRPEASAMADCLDAVPIIEIGGKVYVA